MSAPPRPVPGAPLEYHFPVFERHTLDSGLQVIVAPVRKLPMVTAALVCDAGGSAELAAQAGIAQITARALLEGTRRSDGAELTERFERLGASVSSSADWDAALVQLTVLTERFGEAMELLGEVVLEPALAPRDVERLRAERMSEILQLRAEPRGLAEEMFARVLYRSSSRYGLPQDGSAETISRLTPDDLRAFHGERYRAGSTTLVLAGDLGVEEAMQVARGVFGDWRGEPAPYVGVDEQPARTGRATHLVVKEDAPQSELRIGHVGLPRAHPEYFPVLVMNAILGGLFSSRINLNLRERHGYTYGAFSSYDWRRAAGPFTVSTAVASNVTGAAAREVLTEMDLLRESEVGEEELTLATHYLAGVFPIRYETTGAIARALAAMRIYGLSEDYFDVYRERVLSVTPADVLRVAREHLRPDNLQLLAVGDPDAIRGQLEELGAGPLTVYDADGAQLESASASAGAEDA
jgi:zinc protease